jgi:signal transduction histidine kinase
MRTDFVANVSHELRTPLTIIKGFSETLVDDHDSLSDEAKIRFTNKIKNNAERLHLLVEDLLTLSRLESQPDQLDYSVQALDKLMQEVQESYSDRLIRGEQTIKLAFDSEIQPFVFDRYRINQVLDNLVENAFRYASEFTLLELSAELSEDKSYIICKVSDDGPGIPKKSLPHLFERFYRVDKGRSKEKGGTGLGLSILKHIILLHGGVVRAESKVGEGTSIIFSLPYSNSVED